MPSDSQFVTARPPFSALRASVWTRLAYAAAVSLAAWGLTAWALGWV